MSEPVTIDRESGVACLSIQDYEQLTVELADAQREIERLTEKIKWFNVELSKCEDDRECRECGYVRPQ